MTFIIESGVPIPDKQVRSKYPFAVLKVGESFEFNADDIEKIRTAATNFGKRHNKRFLVRRMNGKARCWRMEE